MSCSQTRSRRCCVSQATVVEVIAAPGAAKEHALLMGEVPEPRRCAMLQLRTYKDIAWGRGVRRIAPRLRASLEQRTATHHDNQERAGAAGAGGGRVSAGTKKESGLVPRPTTVGRGRLFGVSFRRTDEGLQVLAIEAPQVRELQDLVIVGHRVTPPSSGRRPYVGPLGGSNARPGRAARRGSAVLHREAAGRRSFTVSGGCRDRLPTAADEGLRAPRAGAPGILPAGARRALRANRGSAGRCDRRGRT